MRTELVELGKVSTFFNNLRKPITRSDRAAGEYRYFGAAGIQDYVAEFIFDGSYILVGEDGTVTTDDGHPVVQRVSGQFWVNNHAHVIQPKDERDFDYLYYAISSAKVRDLVTGAVQPKLSMTNLKKLELPWATAPEARLAVGEFLKNLDLKIQLNSEISETLEGMSQAIFKSWFIDFDPVKAKMAGEKPEGMNDEIATLFPESLDEATMLPTGWQIARFSQICDLTMGQSPPGDAYNSVGEGSPFYQGRTDFGSRFPTRRIYSTQGNRTANKGETLVSVRAPVGDLNQALEECVIGRGVASVLHKSGSTSYTFSLMQSLNSQLSFFNGEGTVFGAINKKDFENLQTIEPPAELVEAFDEVCAPFEKQIENLYFQNQSLSELRDALLPRLISGELQIPEEMLAS